MTQRIGIVLDFWDYSFNGTAVSTQRFIQALEKQGYEFVILATGVEKPNKVTFKPFSLQPFKWILNKMRTPLALPDDDKIRQTLAQCDLVHVQIPFFLGARVIKIANEINVPVVCSFHVQPENILHNLAMKPKFLINLLYRFFIKHFYEQADCVVCPSLFAQKMLKKQALSTPTHVVSNGIPDRFFHAPRLERFLPKKEYHILSVGRLAKEKHQDLIIKAVAASNYAHKVKLTLVGAGPFEKNVKRLANKYLPGRSHVESVSNEALMRLYQTCDLFIHAGEIELEGMSVMEAMASGLPVIVSDSKDSAAKDFAVNPLSLFHFPSEEDLTSKIDYWLDNPKARAQVAELNYQTALKYSHSASCKKLESIYQRALNQEPLDNLDAVVAFTPRAASGES